MGWSNHDIPLHEGLDPVAARYRFVPQWLVGSLRKRGILLNRDECRTPMQWDDGPNAGFAPAAATPWLPVHPESASVNVAAQERDPESLLRCYRGLLALQARVPGAAGRVRSSGSTRPGLPADVVAYRRAHGEGARRDCADVFLNFSRRDRPARARGGVRALALLEPTRDAGAGTPELRARRPYEGVVVRG